MTCVIVSSSTLWHTKPRLITSRADAGLHPAQVVNACPFRRARGAGVFCCEGGTCEAVGRSDGNLLRKPVTAISRTAGSLTAPSARLAPARCPVGSSAAVLPAAVQRSMSHATSVCSTSNTVKISSNSFNRAAIHPQSAARRRNPPRSRNYLSRSKEICQPLWKNCN